MNVTTRKQRRERQQREALYGQHAHDNQQTEHDGRGGGRAKIAQRKWLVGEHKPSEPQRQGERQDRPAPCACTRAGPIDFPTTARPDDGRGQAGRSPMRTPRYPLTRAGASRGGTRYWARTRVAVVIQTRHDPYGEWRERRTLRKGAAVRERTPRRPQPRSTRVSDYVICMAKGVRPSHRLSFGRTIHAVLRDGRRISSAARIAVLDDDDLDTTRP